MKTVNSSNNNHINNNRSTYLIFAPFILIFLVGIIVPVNSSPHRAIFQPPNWFFGVAWTYISLSFGYISYIYYTKNIISSKKNTLLIFYWVVLGLINIWLFLNYYKLYNYAFYELVLTCYTSILYLVFLLTYSTQNTNHKYILFLLPLQFWLVLASCLNGVIYDYVSG